MPTVRFVGFADPNRRRVRQGNVPRKYKFVVVAKLSPEHGRIMPTPGPTNTHHTLWKYENVSFHTLFQVLE